MLMLIHCVLLPSMLRVFVRRVVMFGHCFAVHYLVSFIVLQPSGWGGESWLLYLNAFQCHLTISAM